MKEKMPTIDIRKFKSLFPAYLDSELYDDFFIADFEIGPERKKTVLDFPCRIDGYVALFCIRGGMDIDINLSTFKVEENFLLINVPGNILRLSRLNADTVHVFVAALSRELFGSVRVDLKKLFNESMSLLAHPLLRLDDREIGILKQYIGLASAILASGFDNRKDTLCSLIASVFYLVGSIWTQRLSIARQNAPVPSARPQAIFSRFMKLVAEYHTAERGMAFYAARLCLTPKYLSRLVKTVSGTSAPDWIDSFVILEAKNMLKYSDLTIKEIVYRLNFSNPSVFYKFFKSHTGMTPSEYRES